MRTSVRMFAGQLDGHLTVAYISHTKEGVRDSISKMFLTPPSWDVDISVRDRLKAAWVRARKGGWKVVRVVVTSEE